jgi:AraC-like DNA-binding protein
MAARLRRQVLEPPATHLAELQLLGHTSQNGAAEIDLGRHRHDHAWELCWFASGTADWWAGGAVHELAAGWCYLTRPGEEHGALTGLLESYDLHWLQLAPPDEPALAAALAAAPHAFPAPALGPLWRDLWAEVVRRGPLAALATRGALHRLLVAALTASRPQPSAPIRRALARADEGRATVVALARAAGLSRSVFHQRFHDELGDSPAAWLRRQRLREAKRLLWRTDHPITAIAHAGGFATSQRFATAFRETTGLAPQAWRDHVRRFASG